MEKLRRSQRTTKGVAAPKLGYTDTQSYAGASGGDDRMTESRSQAVTANSADRLSARIAVLQAEQAVAEKRLEIARLTEQAMSEAEGTLRERSVAYRL